MYEVVTDDEVGEQIAALPDDLLRHYAELLDLLEVAPWSSRPYNESNPDGNLRTRSFGPAGRSGLVVFLVLERERRVELVRVAWLH